MKTYRATTTHRETQRWFFAALGLLVAIFILYIYFVSASVAHVVIRKEVNQEILHTRSYVSQLEAQYIEAQHAVSADIASAQGFTRTSEKVFIDRTAASLVLSENNDS